MSFLYDIEKKTFTFSRFVNMTSLSCRRLALTLRRSFSQPTSKFSTSRTACAQVSVQTDADGIATVSMNKAPVNSLNTEFIQELTQAVVDTEKIAKVNFHLQKHPDSRASTSTLTNRPRNHKLCSWSFLNFCPAGNCAHVWKQSLLRWSRHHGDVPAEPGEAGNFLGKSPGPLAGHLWLQVANDGGHHWTQVRRNFY